MSGTRFTAPYAFFVDPTGTPYIGGQLFFFASGTSTPQNTYEDAALTTPNPNPVVANTAGLFPNIYLGASAYKVILQDSNDVQIWSADPVGASGGAAPSSGLIVGEVREYAGNAGAIPSGWLLCYGQAVSRTTFSLLFGAIGTIWGAGDGSATFNVPDRRGRAAFGLDNMGGTPANRVTAGGCGIAGTVLGASGGDQFLMQHLHTVTDPGHVHVMPAAVSATGGTVGLASSGTVAVGNPNTDPAVTNISIAVQGAGVGQNMPPAVMSNFMIYAGA